MTFSKLGTDTDSNQTVYLPKTARLKGLYIIGLQGFGKSGLMENLIMQDIKQGIGVAVLDPKRDLVDNVIARLPSDREKDVILLDLADEDYPFGLNLFECPNLNSRRAIQTVVDQVRHVFEKLLGVSEETQLILQYLYNCTYTLVVNPGYTMADIPLLLDNKHCRQKLVANVKDRDVLGFWEQYELKTQGRQSEEIASTIRRVKQLLQPMLRPIVGQSTSTIDLQTIMNEGKIVLVKLDRTMKQTTTIVGSILVALILKASASRPAQRKQFHLYADEFQWFATEDFVTLVEEARYADIGVTMAHQNRAQLEASEKRVEEQLKDRTLNVGSIVVFRVPTDGEELAGQFDTTPPPAWEEELEEEWVEVLKPEWYERVQEVVTDGEDAVIVYERDVVGHLLKHGHTKPEVEEFITKYLRPIDRASKIPPDPYRDRSSSGLIGLKISHPAPPGYYQPNISYVYEHTDLQEALPYINDVLYDEMSGKNIFLGIKTPGHSFELVNSDCYYTMIGVLEDFLGYDHYWVFAMLEEANRNVYLEYLDNPKDARLRGAWKNVQQRLINQYGKGYEWSFTDNKAIFTIEYERWKLFTDCLKATAQALKQQPIQTKQSGQYQPRTRTQISYLTHPRETVTHPRVAITHPQQSRADKEKEIAGHLVHLNKFTAWVKIAENMPQNPGKECLKCKLLNAYGALYCKDCGTKLPAANEYVIETLPPENRLYGKTLDDRFARIQAHNRKPDQFGHVYCRSWQEVDAEIAKRQTSCSSGATPVQPQPQQPTPQQPQARHARQVPLKKHCSTCGFQNDSDAKYCKECGTKFA